MYPSALIVIISIPRLWRPLMGAGRLWHMVGRATSGRYNAPPMCHGCQKCYGPTDINKLGNKTMIDLYNKTILKEQKLKEDGYNVISIWECEYNEILKKVKKINQNNKDDIHTQRYNNEELKI